MRAQCHVSAGPRAEASLESLGTCACADFSQSALSSELSSTVIESDNPFTDASGSPLQCRSDQYQEFAGSPLRHTGNSGQNTAFSDEPKGIAMPTGSWKLPRCLSRSSSQVATESSPLRWCAAQCVHGVAATSAQPGKQPQQRQLIALRPRVCVQVLFKCGSALPRSGPEPFPTSPPALASPGAFRVSGVLRRLRDAAGFRPIDSRPPCRGKRTNPLCPCCCNVSNRAALWAYLGAHLWHDVCQWQLHGGALPVQMPSRAFARTPAPPDSL
jgi:hypothetical protein